MNFRTKSKLFGKWAFIKYLGDGTIYAACQNCGYTYACYKTARDDEGHIMFLCQPDINKIHKYCPHCGLKMSLWDGENVHKLNKYLWGEILNDETKEE